MKQEEEDADNSVVVMQHPNHGRSSSSPPTQRNTDNLFLLTTDQADKMSFPEGCCVIYNFQPSRSTSTNTMTTNVRKGIVKSVSLNTDKKRFEFRIQRSDSANSEPILDDAIEDDIAYAIHCPVMVKASCNAASSGIEDGVEGVILFAKPVNDGSGNMRMSYIVQYVMQGNLLRMEEGVVADRISYNRKMISDQKDDREASGKRPLVANEQSAAPPVLVPNLSSNNSEGGSQKDFVFGDSEGLEKTSGNGDNVNLRGGDEKYPWPTNRNELPKTPMKPTNNDQPKSPSNNLLPQSNIYVQKPTHKMVTATKNDLSPEFDGGTSPLTCEFFDSGNDRPVQHKRINFQPPSPSKKRSTTISIAYPPILSKRSEEPCERPKKSLKTEMADHQRGRKPGSNVRNPGEELKCQLTVPLWVNYGDSDLFLHMVGVGKNGITKGYKTQNILAETACRVHISRCNPERGIPMKIIIRTDSLESKCDSDSNPHKNMEKALMMVEESLFHYMEIMDGCSATARLRFELRAGSLGNSCVPRAESGAVQIDHNRWMQVLELSCVKKGWVINTGRKAQQLNRELLQSIWDNTKCTAEVFADCPDMPLKLCKPYVLVQGRELKWVDRATAMITDAKRQSMT